MMATNNSYFISVCWKLPFFPLSGNYVYLQVLVVVNSQIDRFTKIQVFQNLVDNLSSKNKTPSFCFEDFIDDSKFGIRSVNSIILKTARHVDFDLNITCLSGSRSPEWLLSGLMAI